MNVRSMFGRCAMALNVCITAIILGLAPPAHALPSGQFEIDGNATDDASVSGDDWGTLYKKVGGSAFIYEFIPDPVATQTTFNNGSKDTQDISKWGFAFQSAPPKDDLTNAYAAAYGVSGVTLYFGSDRASNSGDTTIGFWFFKDNVTIDKTAMRFIGQHRVGDILVVSDFTNGGTTHTLVVYQWQGADGPNGYLKQIDSKTISSSNPSNCFDLTSTTGQLVPGAVCAATNPPTVNVPSPWPYPPTATTTQTFPPGTFFEGGIDLSGLLPGDTCFSSFMATTRSSTSANASLKNFVIGQNFNVCSLEVKKYCTSPVLLASKDVKYTVTGSVTNTGLGSLQNFTVQDSPDFDANSLGWYACDGNGQPITITPAYPSAVLLPGQQICYQGTNTYKYPVTTTPSDTITASAEDSTGASYPAKSVTATCPPPPDPPQITLSKVCTSCLDASSVTNRVVLKTNFSGTVCNTSLTVPLTNVVITDSSLAAADLNIDLNNFTLGVATTDTISGTVPTCQTFTGSYYPTAVTDATGATTLTPYNGTFSDTITVTGTPSGQSNQTLGTISATCGLCEATSVCSP